MLHVDLSQLAGGTLQEKFDREITRVIDNMQDPCQRIEFFSIVEPLPPLPFIHAIRRDTSEKILTHFCGATASFSTSCFRAEQKAPILDKYSGSTAPGRSRNHAEGYCPRKPDGR